MLHAFDHAIVAVSDLAAATERTAALLGAPPSWRGSHPGAGSANALFRVANCYLELLARDGEGPIGAWVDARIAEEGEGLAGIVFATDDAFGCAEGLRARGLAAAAPVEGSGRDDTSGAERRWRNVHLPLDATRGLLVFVIEHRSPADALPLRAPEAPTGSVVEALDHVVVASPDLEASGRLYGAGLGLRLALDRSFTARGLRMLFFRVGGVTVEVVGRLDADPDGGETDRFGGLAWRVGDASAARERLGARGFDVSEVRDGAKPGTRVCTVRDGCCGVSTLLVEPAARVRPGPGGR